MFDDLLEGGEGRVTGLSIGRAHQGAVVHRMHGTTTEATPLQAGAPALELDQVGDFIEFFAAALPLVHSLHWVLQDVVFSTPEAWDRSFDPAADRYTGPEWQAFFGEEIASQNTTRVVRPGFLQAYGQYIVDDWCKILGLAGAPSDPLGFLAGLGGGEPTAVWLPALRPRVEAAFFCIDGVRWELFARDSALLTTVRERLASRHDLVVREMTLAETVA